MKENLKYINRFTKELKLVIYLSQEVINKDEISVLSQHIDWEVFLFLVIKHRLVSQIYKHIQYLERDTPKEVLEKLKQTKLEQSGISLQYTVFLLRVHEKLKEKDITHFFFKGPLLSFELYQDVGFRNFRDIDILVDLENIEKARLVIEELGYVCIYPHNNITIKQRKINYTISHHYHFKNWKTNIDIELHWNITNPKSFYGKETREILSRASSIIVSNKNVPYISRTDNLIYLAAHGAAHQWYRLFWLKDFSILLSKSSADEIKVAFDQAKKFKLDNCFVQACKLSKGFYHNTLPDFLDLRNLNHSLLQIPIQSIKSIDLKQKGLVGKIKYICYRMKLKPMLKYYLDLIYRLRTHLKDWEIITISDRFFFLYYVLRPFLLLYRFLIKREGIKS